MALFILFLALVAMLSAAQGFAPSTHKLISRQSQINMAFDLNKAVSTLSQNKILTKTAQLGLLSRLEKAGFSLSSAIPLLKFADDNDLIGVLEASSDKVLPLIGQAIELAPSLLPLAGTALKAPPTVLFGGAATSLLAAAALIAVVPDDSVATIGLQAALAIPLGIILPGALGVGGVVLTKLK